MASGRRGFGLVIHPAKAVPLDQTNSHTFRDADHTAKPLALKELRNIVTTNPIHATQHEASLLSSPANRSSTDCPGHSRIALTAVDGS